MKLIHHKTQSPDPPRDELDRLIDAALAKYAAVNPRLGLEERIVANLHSAGASASLAFWRWTLATALAAVAIVGLALTLVQRKHSAPATNRPSTTARTQREPQPRMAGTGVNAPSSQRRETIHKSVALPRQPDAVVAAYPKLDQFPAPQPLSEQEKLLTSYIARSRNQAVLVARARTEELRRDQQEKLRELDAANGNDSRPQ